MPDNTDDDDWFWYCRGCGEKRERGDDALICDDVDECVRSEEWGGCACGYVVCAECRRPLVELHTSVRDDADDHDGINDMYARPDDGPFQRPDDQDGFTTDTPEGYARAGDDERVDR